MKYCIKNVVSGSFVNYNRKLGDIFEEKEIKPGMLYNNKSDADDDVEVLNKIDIAIPYKVVKINVL